MSYLEIILGPMCSKKTSYLLDVHEKCRICNIPVASINHSFDNQRYDGANRMSNHNLSSIPCISGSTLIEVYDSHKKEIDDADVILINEGQFFEDLYKMVIQFLKFNKKIYVCGLDGDFNREKFGQILDLIPYCDKEIGRAHV